MKTLIICIMTIFLTNIGLGQVLSLKDYYHDYINQKFECGYLLIESLFQRWERNNWDNGNSRKLYRYDANGNKIEVLHQQKDGDKWEDGYKSSFIYDRNGNLIEGIHHSRRLYKIIYRYNVDGYITESLTQERHEPNWVNNIKHLYRYNKNGNYINELVQYWHEPNWVKGGKNTLSYDVNGNMIEELRQIRGRTGWVDIQKNLYGYNADGFLDRTRIFECDEDSQGNWVYIYKWSYSYDVNGNMIEELRQIWKEANWVNSFKYTNTWEQITSISEQAILVNNFQLHQNYPNPFNPSTTIEFSLPKSELTTLKVYNILGKEVTKLVSKKLNQGNHIYTFDGRNLASGIYYYQLVAGDYREVKKMILLR